MKDLYKTLKIDSSATESEVKKAYRVLAVKYHPDKNFDGDSNSEKFIEITEAYNILLDSEKRKVYDLKYNLHFGKENVFNDTNSSNTNAKFEHEPFKNVFNSKDRSINETPSVSPEYDLYGNRIIGFHFFKIPKYIGKIIGANSNYKKDEKFEPQTKPNLVRIFFGYLISILLSAAIIVLFRPNYFWAFVWAVLPFAIYSFYVWLITRPENVIRYNYFIGLNGFAKYIFHNHLENLVTDFEMNFEKVTDLYVYQMEHYYEKKLQNTEYIYLFLNNNNGEIPYVDKGVYYKETDIQGQFSSINFCRMIEHYWTIYLLDNMEFKLQQAGCLWFTIYDHTSNKYSKYIKLGIGEITFLKEDNKEFTYRFDEIKTVYISDNKLFIQHRNFSKQFFFMKSGNEEIIPLLNLCNRRFFYKAFEILLGYSLDKK